MRILTLLFLMALFGSEGISQNILILEKEGSAKRERFFEGNTFTYSKISDEERISGIITSIRPDTIFVDGFAQPINDIGVVYFPDRYLPKLLSRILIIGGTAYFVVDNFNQVITGERPFDRPATFWISGASVGSGLLLNLAAKRQYKMGKKYRLRVLNITP